jgi:hypothetical protein
MKNIFIIQDKGKVWEITDTTIQPDDYVVDPDMVIEVDNQLFSFVKNKIGTSQIQYSKDVIGKLIKEDLMIVDYDPITSYKEKILNKGREYISTRLNAVSLFELYEFLVCNLELIEKGFVITNKNRRQKYLDIIDAGDIETIDLLERLLNSKDKLESISGWYNQYRTFEKDVYKLNKIDDIDERYKVFVQIFE